MIKDKVEITISTFIDSSVDSWIYLINIEQICDNKMQKSIWAFIEKRTGLRRLDMIEQVSNPIVCVNLII